MSLLTVSGVSLSFGGIHAAKNLSFSVQAQETFGVIGPNGAGKSTLFNLLTGIYTPDQGSIELRDRARDGDRPGTTGELLRIEQLPPYRRARLGIARTFQNNRLFGRMTALEHVLLGMEEGAGHHRPAEIARMLGLPSTKRFARERREKALQLMEAFHLEPRAHQYPSELPYGLRKRLEIARAIATGARLVLLDEPAAGLNEAETQDLRQTLVRLKSEFSLTLIVIEHDVEFVMGLCQRIAVLNQGEMIALGTPEAVRKDPRVIEAYLGQDAEALL